MKLELVDPFSSRAEATWRTLEEHAKPVYFLTWAWMENWLACLPRNEAPQLAVITRDGDPIAAGFLRRRWLRRHAVVVSRAYFLNSIGDSTFDDICLEHNALLTRDPGVSFATLVSLLPGGWDELHLPACSSEAFAALQAAPLGRDLQVTAERDVANYHVELAKVREKGYVPLLGSSTRAQIRKAQRAAGDVTVEIAGDEQQATDIFNELVALHTRSWQERGHSGAFADPFIDQFHRRLIATRFGHGDIQLVRVKNRDLTIGCLYNLVSAGRVLFYQCGFGTPADRHLRPGYLCHAHAIEHCAKQNHDIYDLLGGDARYKQSLATDETRLIWARVQRRRPHFALENLARVWVKRAKARWAV